MGAAIGTDDKKSVNVELNIVPFIDLMSCLTAFLLVTAVWTNIAQLSIKPKGKSRDQSAIQDPERDVVKGSVLIQPDTIWIGLSRINEFQPIAKIGTEHDWVKFEATLNEQKKTNLAERRDIEIAAEDKVSYQDIIRAMDIAVRVGFPDVGISDPAGLSARPSL